MIRVRGHMEWEDIRLCILPLYRCSCSGYGSQSCYSCYSGQFCKTKEDTMSCRLSAGPGNPIYLSEYWLNGSSHDPCTSVLGHYRYYVNLIWCMLYYSMEFFRMRPGD